MIMKGFFRLQRDRTAQGLIAQSSVHFKTLDKGLHRPNLRDVAVKN